MIYDGTGQRFGTGGNPQGSVPYGAAPQGGVPQGDAMQQYSPHSYTPYGSGYRNGYLKGHPTATQAAARPRRRSRGLIGVFLVILVAFAAAGGVLLLATQTSTGLGGMIPSRVTEARGSESQEIWDKIMEPHMTDEEGVLLSRMRGTWEKVADEVNASDPSMELSWEGYEEATESGRWPLDTRWGTPETQSANPQLWVRLAIMAKQWLRNEIPGEWEVIDFSYPIGAEGEDASVLTRLIGTSNDTLGMVLDVEYHRWEDMPRFSLVDGQEEAARENHERMTRAYGAITPVSNELRHPVLIQGGETPVVFVNLIGSTDDGGTAPDYELLLAEKLSYVTRRVAQGMTDAGFPAGEVRIASWSLESLKNSIRPTAPFDWRYLLNDDEEYHSALRGEVSGAELKARLMSGAYACDEGLLPAQATASWNGYDDIQVMEQGDPSGIRIGTEPQEDSQKVFGESGISVSGLPESIGKGDHVLYGCWSAPYDPEIATTLRVYFAYEGESPTMETRDGDAQSAILIKGTIQVPSVNGDDLRKLEGDDGLTVRVCEYPEAKRETEPEWKQESDWVKHAEWTRIDGDGTVWGYKLELYEEISDEEILKIAEGIR